MLVAWIVVAVLIIIWESLPRLGLVDPTLVPPFSDVLVALGSLITQPSTAHDLLITISEILGSFAISVPLAVTVGYFLSLNSTLREVLEPFVNYMLAIPKSVFLPLFLLAFGLGYSQKVAFGVFQAFFVIVVAMMAAMISVPKMQVEYARSLNASRWQLFWHIYRPAIMPLLMEGVRLGLTFTITGVVLAEMYASRGGLGQIVASAGQIFDVKSILASVLLVGLVSISMMELLRWYERSVGSWRKRS